MEGYSTSRSRKPHARNTACRSAGVVVGVAVAPQFIAVENPLDEELLHIPFLQTQRSQHRLSFGWIGDIA